MSSAQQEITDAMNGRVEAFRNLHNTAHILLPEAMAMEFLEHVFPYALLRDLTPAEKALSRLSEVLHGTAPDNRTTLFRLADAYRDALARWEKTLQPR